MLLTTLTFLQTQSGAAVWWSPVKSNHCLLTILFDSRRIKDHIQYTKILKLIAEKQGRNRDQIMIRSRKFKEKRSDQMEIRFHFEDIKNH